MIAQIVEWIKGRMSEPSSYAAIGLVIMGLGIVIDMPVLAFIGIAGGVIGFLLKEKGMI